MVLFNIKRIFIRGETLLFGLLVLLLALNFSQFLKKNAYSQMLFIEQYSFLKGQFSSIPMNDELWGYLRKGLNYLETDGANLAPGFAHPGNKAFGSLGLSYAAVEDVIKKNKLMPDLKKEQVFKDPFMYEYFAKAYADLLLRHYLKVDYSNMPKREVFMILQKAWFTGPSLYKSGYEIIPSRSKRANDFIKQYS